MSRDQVCEGDRVLLTGGGRRYFVRAGPGELSTDLGILSLSAIIGTRPGDILKTHKGVPFTIRFPRAGDFFTHARRSGAPMLPKDIGLVVAYTGMNREDEVLDAGTGSGIAAIYFGGIARRVSTYEIREEFAHLARKNVADAGCATVEVITGDMLDARGSYDIVHLDMGIRPEHITHAHTLLRPGGYLACYTPFIEHMTAAIDTASGLFPEVYTCELLEREITRTARGTRPSTRVGHTGYLTLARR